MNILIGYDSYFINTKKIAEAIAASLVEKGAQVRLERIYQVDFANISDVDIFIIGAPTHLRNMPRPIKSVLKRLPKGTLEGIKILTFDTRYQMPVKKSGSAARQIDKFLRKIGGEPIQPPESFFVLERRGPLAPGEIERAQRWAAGLVNGEKIS